MPLIRHTAFVLSRHPLTESSWIVSLFTRERGKLRAVAKGGRRVKSPFRGALEPFTRVRVELSAKEGQELWSLRVADLEEGALALFSPWDRAAVLFGALEVLERGLADHSAEEETWRLVGAFLAGLRGGASPALAWPWFLYWFLHLHGVLSPPRACVACGGGLTGDPSPPAAYASRQEGWVCGPCSAGEVGPQAPLTREAARLLARFRARTLTEMRDGELPAPAALKGLADVVYLAATGFLGRPLKAAPSLEALYENTKREQKSFSGKQEGSGRQE